MKKILFTLSILVAQFAFAGPLPFTFWAKAIAADTTAPTLSSATIGTNGTTWTLVFNETVSIGSGGNGGWAATMSTAGAQTLTYSSGGGTSTLVYTGSPTVVSGETVSSGLNYTQPGNGIEDAAGNDLATLTGHAVTNNSTQSGGNGLLTGLTAYYNLNGTTTEPDAVGSRTLTNASGANPTSATGILSTARGSAGDAKYLYSSDAAFSPGAGPFSVSFWIKIPTGSSGYPGVVGRYDTGTNNRAWCVLLDDSSVPFLEVSTNGSSAAASVTWTGGLSTGAWHHIVAVISGSQLKIAVDGGTFQTTSFSSTLFASAADMSVLCRLSGGTAAGSLDGYVDEMGFWAKALTQTDVANLYNGGAGLAYGSFN